MAPYVSLLDVCVAMILFEKFKRIESLSGIVFFHQIFIFDTVLDRLEIRISSHRSEVIKAVLKCQLQIGASLKMIVIEKERQQSDR
jgi:hypothetical protein